MPAQYKLTNLRVHGFLKKCMAKLILLILRILVEGGKVKRRNRWGNKYADNK